MAAEATVYVVVDAVHAADRNQRQGPQAKDLKVSGAKLRSVKASGAKVTVTFKSATKSATVNFAKGLSVTKKLETAVTKKKTKSLAIKFTVKYATAASTAGSVTVKKLS